MVNIEARNRVIEKPSKSGRGISPNGPNFNVPNIEAALEGVTGDALLAAIVANTDDAIISKNLNSIILSWNHGAEKIFGYTAEEAIGQPIYLIIPPDLTAEETVILDRLRRGERIEHFETIRRRKDGRRIQVSITVSPLKNKQGEVVGASKIARDITERRETEAALRAAQVELQNYARKMEEVVNERTAELKTTIAELEGFSYSLSHDMRAPLRAIHSFSQIVLAESRAKIAPEHAELLEKVIKAAARLDRLIQDVLTYSRVTRDALALHHVDMEQLFRQIIDERPEFQQPLSDVEILGRIPAVCGHEAYVTQIVTNLLSNAVKFVAPGTKPKVRIRGELAGDWARIWIEDNGIGIPRESQEKIFGIFERMHSEKSYPGTGIGLAIVRKAIDRMRGSCGLESEPGQGTRFWFQLIAAD